MEYKNIHNIESGLFITPRASYNSAEDINGNDTSGEKVK